MNYRRTEPRPRHVRRCPCCRASFTRKHELRYHLTLCRQVQRAPDPKLPKLSTKRPPYVPPLDSEDY